MRFGFLLACLALLGADRAQAQATWDFASGTGSAPTLPANVSGGNFAAANLTSGTLAFNTTSASSGYVGASGGNNAALNAKAGPLATATSTYVEFVLTPAPGFTLSVTRVALGTRSTSTGPTQLTLYSGADNFATALGGASVSANSTWTLVTFSNFNLTGTVGGALTFRLFASDGSGSGAGNWRVDDLAVTCAAKSDQTLSFTPLPARTFGDAPFVLQATASSGLNPQFSIVSGPATLSGATLTMTGAGTVVVRASQPGDASYNPAVVVDQSFVVAAATQTLAFAPLANRTFGDAPFALSAVASSGLAPVFSIVSGPATLNGHTLTLVGAGTVVVRAAQPGDANFLAAPDVDRSFAVAKASQAISFSFLPDRVVGDPPFSIVASASSGLAVNVSVDSGPATSGGAHGATLSLTGATGVVTIRAAQTGDTNYQPATDVVRSFSVLASASPPGIATQPASQTVAAGQSATFSVVATGTGPFTYQWRHDFDLVGTNSSMLTLPAVTTAQAGSYTVVISNSAGMIASQPATLTVQQAPVFTRTPMDLTVTVGDSVILDSLASGNPAPTYAWKKNGAPLSAATSATLRFPAITVEDAGTYEVTASNLLGSISSPPAILVVNKRAQSIAFDPPLAASPIGSALLLQATASSGLPVSFSIVSGLATLSGNRLIAASAAVVIRASQPGSATFAAAPPVERTIAFQAAALAPWLIVTPVDQTVVAGAAAELRASAVGTPTPTYQWLKDGVPIYGATNPTLAFSCVTDDDAGRYVVVATNPAGSASAAATLTIHWPPSIVTAPADRTVFSGETVTLSVVARGSPALNYQWRHRGVALPGATASTLVLAAARLADAGEYDVVVSNPFGSITSAVASLVVQVSATELGRLVNLSARGLVESGAPLIVGFAIGGREPQRLLIRATGPTLATSFNVAGVLADPRLTVFRGDTELMANDDWARTADVARVREAAVQAGAFPLSSTSADAALLLTLDPGAYTVQVTASPGSNPTGIVLVEIYDAP